MTAKVAPSGNGFIYSGNHHDSIPRALFFDQRLTPLERNCWIIIKTLLQSDGITAFPSYETLSKHLMMKPLSDKASSETVARALIVLRLTRWISLVKTRRAQNGQRLHNLYVIHESPLTPFEAIQIDADYFSLMSRTMDHGSENVRRVARHTLKEVVNDPQLAGKVLPTRIQCLIDRMSENGILLEDKHALHDSEESDSSRLRNCDNLTSDPEAGRKPSTDHCLPNPKVLRSSSKNNKIHTTIRQKQLEQLDIPEHFRKLSSKHQQAALDTLANLPLTLQQQILIEWHERCNSSHIRKPAAYLLGIIQKAYRGEFNAFGSQPLQLSLPTAPPPCPASHDTPKTIKHPVMAQPMVSEQGSLTSPEAAQYHIQKIKAIIKRGSLGIVEDSRPP